MAQSRAALAALIAANIADNTSEAITPALHRAVENALSDSSVNWVDDVKTTLNDDNNEVPTSGAVAALIGTPAIPLIPQVYTIALSDVDLIAGGVYDVTPKPPSGFRFVVFDSHFQYTFNTTAMTDLVFEVTMENAGRGIFSSKSGTFGFETTSFFGTMEKIDPSADLNQYTEDKIQIDIVVPATAGDGNVVVYILAMLIPV